MTGPWSRWVAFTGRTIDARPLRLVQKLVALAILFDLFAVVRRDALDAVLLPAAHGGISETAANAAWFAGTPWIAPLWFAALAVATGAVVLGKGVRAAWIVAVVASAQLGHLYIPGDRAIDRLLRTVILLLVASRVSDERPPARVAAWPVDLIRWLLVIVYLQAGVAKLDARPGFLDLDEPELLTILCEPLVGRLDAATWWPLRWLFVVGGGGAVALELAAPLLVTRWCRYWAVFGALLHVGLAIGMELGMFPFGMLALYPVLLSPWTERALDAAAPWLPARWAAAWGPVKEAA